MKTYLGVVSILLLSLGATPVSATVLDAVVLPGFQIGPGGTGLLDRNGQPTQDSQSTGILFTNQSQTDAFVTVEFFDRPPLQPGDLVEPGFQLLDGTLRIGSTLARGEARVRIRMDYSARRLQRRGLRADSVRLMRRIRGRAARAPIWQPAVRALSGRIPGYRFPASPPQPGLWNYGFDAQNSFVWAFVDTTSDYAVGARQIAEPASILCLLAGIGLLWRGRRN